jgi:hypothetical protein
MEVFMNILGLRLISGEEVIADSVFSDNTYTLTNPIQLMFQPSDRGMSVQFAPFPTFGIQKTGQKISIQSNSVVYVYEPSEDLTEQYNKIFGSGLVVPKKGGLSLIRG